jgi:predicted peptidase
MSGSAKVIANLYKWATEKKTGCEAVSVVTAANMVNYAKVNKRWKCQSGHARGKLHGGAYWENPETLKTYIAHGVSYGVFLELANDGKYAILEESINKYKDVWFKSIKRIIEK